MFFENKIHPSYETPQTITAKNTEITINLCQLIQSDFSQLLLNIETSISLEPNDLIEKTLLCLYGEQLVQAQVGDFRGIGFKAGTEGFRFRFSFRCKKITFANSPTKPSLQESVDYIIPYTKIGIFDHYSECANGYMIQDSIPIMGQITKWELKKLIDIGDEQFSVSPFIQQNNFSSSEHLILSTCCTFSPEVENEARNITSLLQLASGNLVHLSCKIIRCNEKIIELTPLCKPNKNPRFWSPLGESTTAEGGRIRQFVEKALPLIHHNSLTEYSSWRSILATYATMNMQHVHLEHRLLFCYMLLDSLYNMHEGKEKPQTATNHRTLEFDSSELEHDIAEVFHKHHIPKAEKAARRIIVELEKRGQGRGKVQSFEERVSRLFSHYSCQVPASEDLNHRNDVVHEGRLKQQDTGEALMLMSRIFNAVTRLLFAIFGYQGSIDFFPEDKWKVTK